MTDISRHLSRVLIPAAVLAGLVLAGCDDSSGSASGSATGSTSSASPTTAAPTSPAAAVSDAGSQPFSTRYFTSPLDLTLPSWLDPSTVVDNSHFVTFSSSDDTRAVRILKPAGVYRPGSTRETAVPADYLPYFLSQVQHGGRMADRVDTTVAGDPAVVVTATTRRALDGSIGCPTASTAAGDCFGLQPDLALRVAIITTDQGPLLIWLRSSADAPDLAAGAAQFADLLKTMRFADRAAAPAPEVVATPLDGVYDWTISRKLAAAFGITDDGSHNGLKTFPKTFTATLDTGAVKITENTSPDVETGTYDATPTSLDMVLDGEKLSFTVVRDRDGSLRLSAVPPIDPFVAYFFTKASWQPE